MKVLINPNTGTMHAVEDAWEVGDQCICGIIITFDWSADEPPAKTRRCRGCESVGGAYGSLLDEAEANERGAVLGPDQDEN